MNYQKVRDHCHCTGKYKGAAHSICNFKFNVPNQIPPIFQNNLNYDHHFIIKGLVNKFVGQFNARFMACSFSNLVHNLAEQIHKFKCQDCGCFIEYESLKDNLRKDKCLSCNKNYSNKLNEKLKKRFKNIFKFSHNDINKFIFY